MSPTYRRSAAALAIALLTLALAACGGSGDTASAATPDGHDHEENAEHAPSPQAAGHDDDGRDENGRDEDGQDGEAHDETGGERTRIPADIAEASGIRVAAVAAGEIADAHEVQGLLTPVDGRVAEVMARYPGPIRALHARAGDRVRAGQTLAVIESNLSLSSYGVTSPLDGTVLSRSATVGTVAGEGQALFEVADLSELWVDLHVFGADAGHIAAGSPVTVTRMSDGVQAQTVLERVLPATATASQSTVARALIANEDGLWRPGSAVRARVTVERFQAERVVPLGALQRDGETDVVYVREGEDYLARPVRIGRRDAERAEILDGVAIGEQVVVEQSFLVKADIGKAAAEHSH
ncbi:efflux RND transporter periplasmic adaptor subunit [Marilutibacter maris]|nr:efflux RND transporter periplasmic adaptor subunit [Lysobacter maris]